MFYIFHPNPVLNPLLLKITLKALKYMRNIETHSSFVFFLGPSLSPVPRILIYAARPKINVDTHEPKHFLYLGK